MAGSPQRLRAALSLAAAGAVLTLMGLLGPPGDLAGSVGIVVGALLAFPYRRRVGAGGIPWWPPLLAAAALAAVGGPVSFASETAGGLVAGSGGVLAIVAAALGFPERHRAGL